LVYDFYNFPKQYYEQTFTSHGDPKMVVDIQEALKEAGVEVEPVKRGLDHGVWGECGATRPRLAGRGYLG
jgi:4,5-DOPA dioxygenase extradiol